MHALAEIYRDDEYQPLRAELYRLLGTLLAAPPNRAVLAGLQQLAPENTSAPLAALVAGLAPLAAHSDVEELNQVYTELFIGIGRGELVPYASWYSSGFVLDKSLARLREDLKVLGFVRDEAVREPEDHVAALCDVMSQMIEGEAPADLDTQRRFFTNHLLPWLPRFFDELQQAAAADDFYRAVGELGSQWLIEEKQYLENIS